MLSVLIADDEKYVRKGVRSLINWQEQGYVIQGEAGDGLEAWEWIVKHRPDVVITDIKMPGLSGIELIEKAMAAELTATRFLILSGYGEFRYAQQAVRYGVQDYLLKPIDEQELKASLIRLRKQLGPPVDQGGHAGIPVRLIQKWAEGLEENDADRIKRCLAQIRGALEGEGAAQEIVQAAGRRMLAALTKTLRQMGGDPDDLVWLQEVARVQFISGGLAVWELQWAALSMEGARRIAELRRDLWQSGVHKVKLYIEAHFRQPLHLKRIAKEFYMNPAYLGQLFRKTYGIYFNEYLLQLRIDEAKKLLRQTEMRVYEIAESCGFSSADYFVTQFEKLERMSPTAYRNRLLL